MARSLCVLTAFNSRFKDVAAISLKGMRRFADAHDYDLRVVERDDCTRRGGWIKIEPIIKVLAESFNYVLWLDADTVVARTQGCLNPPDRVAQHHLEFDPQGLRA